MIAYSSPCYLFYENTSVQVAKSFQDGLLSLFPVQNSKRFALCAGVEGD